MDRGAWWATVHGVSRELDTTEQANDIWALAPRESDTTPRSPDCSGHQGPCSQCPEAQLE